HGFQGYKIGDVRGGVSIAVPLKSLEAEQKKHIFIMIMSHMIIWGIGCVGIWSGTRRLRKGIHEQNITTKTVKESLAQKEALNKELHHRVKNNMQLIISLLNLQASEIEEPELANKFIVAKNRINSMALIHELLYDEKDITRINMEPYIQRLVLDLFESLNIYTESISAIVDMPDISFPIEMATPCGLLVNELVSNSLKHAFLDNKKGEIVISIHSLQENKYELTVSDNGRGIPENIDIKNPATFGLILVNTLISQLEGEVTIGLSRGTVFKILFNETKSKAMKL
ncbi:MAG: sensor histidine kinase, partial [Spirochaetales bacterium]|nr:sensor histidine kinase [Spirochaetales bacterium]